MATERVTERTDGVTAERTVERSEPSVVASDRRDGGMSRTLLTLAVIAVLALVAFFLLRPMLAAEESKDNAVAGAASAVEGAAENVGEAARSAADAVTPE